MFLTRRFYIALVLVILLLGSGYVFAPFFVIGQWALFVLLLVVLADVYSLYRIRGIRAFPFLKPGMLKYLALLLNTFIIASSNFFASIVNSSFNSLLFSVFSIFILI